MWNLEISLNKAFISRYNAKNRSKFEDTGKIQMNKKNKYKFDGKKQ